MFKSLNNYQKFRYTLIALGVLMLLVYFFGIRKTVSEYNLYRHNKTEMNALVKNVSTGDSSLSSREKYKNLVQQYLLDSSLLDRNILTMLTNDLSDLNLILKEYKPLAENKEHVWTRYITVEGKFNSLLNLIYNLEVKEKPCRIASVNFQKIKNTASKGWLLDCTIYFQNILNK